jgi:uncharacterized protein
MNILYIHGFGSRFDPASEKIQALSNLGTVYGIDLDYTQPFAKNLARCEAIVEQLGIELVVGTSMGGFMASHVATAAGADVKFVALNPCVDPGTMLSKYLGTHTDHYGVEYTLTQLTLDQMPYFNKLSKGVVMLDAADDVIPAADTVAALGSLYPVITFDGGSHRFEHMADAVAVIEAFMMADMFVSVP